VTIRRGATLAIVFFIESSTTEIYTTASARR